jgi:hypothetical protein
MSHNRVSTARTMLMRVIRMMLFGADGKEFVRLSRIASQ